MQAAEDTSQLSRRGKSAGPNIKALLITLLASVVFAAGCGGSEEPPRGSNDAATTDDEARKEDTKKSKESTEGGGSDREVTLNLEGDAGTVFSGTCSVGDEEESITGQVPESFSYELGAGSWSARSRNKTAPVPWRFPYGPRRPHKAADRQPRRHHKSDLLGERHLLFLDLVFRLVQLRKPGRLELFLGE